MQMSGRKSWIFCQKVRIINVIYMGIYSSNFVKVHIRKLWLVAMNMLRWSEWSKTTFGWLVNYESANCNLFLIIIPRCLSSCDDFFAWAAITSLSCDDRFEPWTLFFLWWYLHFAMVPLLGQQLIALLCQLFNFGNISFLRNHRFAWAAINF